MGGVISAGRRTRAVRLRTGQAGTLMLENPREAWARRGVVLKGHAEGWASRQMDWSHDAEPVFDMTADEVSEHWVADTQEGTARRDLGQGRGRGDGQWQVFGRKTMSGMALKMIGNRDTDGSGEIRVELWRAQHGVGRMLLDDYEADVSVSGETVLTRAVNEHRLDICMMALDRAGNARRRRWLMSKTNSSGDTPLGIAVRNGIYTYCEMFVRAGANVENAGKRVPWMTALQSALLNNRPEISKLLIKAGANVHVVGHARETTLYMCCMRMGSEAAEDIGVGLLLRGADPNAPVTDTGRMSPLILVAMVGLPRLCKLLIKMGANVNATGTENETALYTAACFGHLTVFQILLAAGARRDVARATVFGLTPLYAAATRGCCEMCNILISAGAPVNNRTNAALSPLFGAVKRGHSDVCSLLLARGANPACVDDDGNTPLCTAVCIGRPGPVYALLMSKTVRDTLHHKTRSGMSAIQIAADACASSNYVGCLHTCSLLTIAGAALSDIANYTSIVAHVRHVAVWTPKYDKLFPPGFRRAVRTLLLCARRRGSLIFGIDTFILLHIISFCHGFDFNC